MAKKKVNGSSAVDEVDVEGLREHLNEQEQKERGYPNTKTRSNTDWGCDVTEQSDQAALKDFTKP